MSPPLSRTERLAQRLAPGHPDLQVEARAIVRKTRQEWQSAGDGGPFLPRLKHLMATAERGLAVRMAPLGLPCEAGCNACCKNQRIVVSEEEATLLIKHVERHMLQEDRDALLERAARAEATSSTHTRPCVFLTESGCAAYAARPMACRSYCSTSRSACERKVDERTTAIPRPAVSCLVEQAVYEISGVGSRRPLYEMNSLMKRVLLDSARRLAWVRDRPSHEPDLALDRAQANKALQLKPLNNKRIIPMRLLDDT